MRIPLFMRMPGTVASGFVSDTPVGGVDLMPTLLSLCGLPIPKTCAGINKSAAARGLTMPEIDSIYCEHNTPWRAVVDGRYKLIIQGTTALSLSAVDNLYDLDTDPFELNNLKDDPAYAAIKQQLYNRLLLWLAETDDPYPGSVTKAKQMYTT